MSERELRNPRQARKASQQSRPMLAEIGVGEGGMTYCEAALQILSSARHPLSTWEITDRAVGRGLLVPRVLRRKPPLLRRYIAAWAATTGLSRSIHPPARGVQSGEALGGRYAHSKRCHRRLAGSPRPQMSALSWRLDGMARARAIVWTLGS
jgi:hypothetical protein